MHAVFCPTARLDSPLGLPKVEQSAREDGKFISRTDRRNLANDNVRGRGGHKMDDVRTFGSFKLRRSQDRGGKLFETVLNIHRLDCRECENGDSYVVGSKSFRPDMQRPRQMESAVRDI